MRDLRPYLCTYPECKEGGQLYDRWKDWASHEQWTHNRTWRCSCSVENVFETIGDFEAHWKKHHTDPGVSFHDAASTNAVLSDSPRRLCPICFRRAETVDQLQRHIATHLQRIAVFALPNSTDADGDSREGTSNIANRDQTGEAGGSLSTGQSSYFSSKFENEVAAEPILDATSDALTKETLEMLTDTAGKRHDGAAIDPGLWVASSGPTFASESSESDNNGLDGASDNSSNDGNASDADDGLKPHWIKAVFTQSRPTTTFTKLGTLYEENLEPDGNSANDYRSACFGEPFSGSSAGLRKQGYGELLAL